MLITNPNPGDESSRFSLEKIWQQGCAKAALSNHDWLKFVSLARNRFYTFELGHQHALESKQRENGDALQSGFVSEMLHAPGLESIWTQSEFCQSKTGRQTFKLLKRRKFKQRFRFV